MYGIVKQNDGFINVYSEPGQGTTFKIYLPEVAAEVVETTAADKTQGPAGRGETVLLVEDEKSVRVTCSLFLESLGYQVTGGGDAGRGPEAGLRASRTFDLLLTDVVMPGMDGRQLANGSAR